MSAKSVLLAYTNKKTLQYYLLLPLVVHWLAVAYYCSHPGVIDQFPLDDAWIHRVYSQSLATGQGFAYNPGQQETGSSSPLWSIMTAPPHWFEGLGVDSVVLLVKLFGVICSTMFIVLLYMLQMHLGVKKLVAGITTSILALDPKLLYSSLSGMETILFVNLYAWAWFMLLKRRYLSFLFLLGLTPVARPEALIFLPFAITGILPILKSSRAWWIKLLAIVLPVLPMVLWVLQCFWVNGHPLPTTYYVKNQRPALSYKLVETAFVGVTQYGLINAWLFVGALTAFFLWCYRRNGKSVQMLLLGFVILPALFAGAIVASRHFRLNGYYWTRYIDPTSHLFMLSFCIATALLLNGQKYRKAVVTLTLIITCISLPTFWGSFQTQRARLGTDGLSIKGINVMAGMWINEHTAKDDVVAVNDAGAIRYFGKRHTVDLMGLNHYQIAFKQTRIEQLFTEIDYVAVFPDWFPDTSRNVTRLFINQSLKKDFIESHRVTMSPDEYTVTVYVDNVVKVIYEKKKTQDEGDIN